MKIDTISMPKKKAKALWLKYNEIQKQRKHLAEGYVNNLKRGYYYMSKGMKLLDIHEVMKQCGLNKGLPKLAIARADIKKILYEKYSDGSSVFREEGWRCPEKKKVYLPKGTFGFEKEESKSARTLVPIVPPDLLPKGKLENYWVLWEVDNWEEVPSDPILLKRISSKLFVILAGWNLTKLEKAIMK